MTLNVNDKLMKKEWDKRFLADWITIKYPDFCWRMTASEIDLYLARSIERAENLGFQRTDHYQYLIGYAVEYSIDVLNDQGAHTEKSGAHQILLQKTMAPELRIKLVEHMMYGLDG